MLLGDDQTTQVEASALLGNSAATGSGLDVHQQGAYTMRASLLAGNAGANCAALIISNGANLSDDNSCNLGQDDIENTPAQLGPLQDNGGPTHTHALQPGSPAIDQAPCDRPTDQRGVARPYDGDADGKVGCDIGAYERIFIVFHPGNFRPFPQRQRRPRRQRRGRALRLRRARDAAGGLSEGRAGALWLGRRAA